MAQPPVTTPAPAPSTAPSTAGQPGAMSHREVLEALSGLLLAMFVAGMVCGGYLFRRRAK